MTDLRKHIEAKIREKIGGLEDDKMQLLVACSIEAIHETLKDRKPDAFRTMVGDYGDFQKFNYSEEQGEEPLFLATNI